MLRVLILLLATVGIVRGDIEKEETDVLNEAFDLLDEAFAARLGEGAPQDADRAIELALQSVEKGVVEGNAVVGDVWLHGVAGHAVDYAKAREFYQLGADAGDPRSQYNLGLMYATGAGVPQDNARAVLLTYLAATGDYTPAVMALAFRHLHGNGVPHSCDTAAMYYEKVARRVADEFAQGHLQGGAPEEALLRDAGVRHAGVDDTADADDDVVAWWQERAEAGHPDAQVLLGQLHQHGLHGVQPDAEAARGLYQRAADQGDAAANAHLGIMRLEGANGQEPDPQGALPLLQQAAEANEPVALNALGYMHLNGLVSEDGKPDFAKAQKFLKKSADLGNADASFHLGAMYHDGRGVTQSFGTAMRYFRAAGARGHLKALYHVGQMHRMGLGTLKSCSMAVASFKSVAQRGFWTGTLEHARRAFALGNYEDAFWLYAKLAEAGYASAQQNAAFLLLHRLAFLQDENTKNSETTQLVVDDAFANVVDAVRAFGVEVPTEYSNVTSEIVLATTHRDLAFRYLHMAAQQRVADAARQLGDLYWEPELPRLTAQTWSMPAPYSHGALKADAVTSAPVPPQRSVAHMPRRADSGLLDAVSRGTSSNDTVSEGSQGSDSGSELELDQRGLPSFDLSEYSQEVRIAAKYYRLAAEGGDAHAMWNLGYMSDFAHGVGSDLRVARAYYRAALRADEEAVAAVALSLALLEVRAAASTMYTAVTHPRDTISALRRLCISILDSAVTRMSLLLSSISNLINTVTDGVAASSITQLVERLPGVVFLRDALQDVSLENLLLGFFSVVLMFVMLHRARQGGIV